MFDFFRDTFLELSGIDSDLAKLERAKKEQAKKEKKEKDKIIIPSWVKKFIMAFSAIYLVSCLGTFQIILNSGIVTMIVRYVVQIVSACAIFILMLFKSKKTEIAGIVLIVLFFILQYSGLFLL